MEWIENSRQHYRTKFDGEVNVIFVDEKERGNKVIFKFRKNSFLKISTNENDIVFAQDENKIYFKEAGSLNGFKLRDYGIATKMIKVNATDLNLTKDNCGEYDLDYDSDLGLCYINLYKKLEKQLTWKGVR